MSAIVHVGNVLDILPTLEAGSVNCVVTSPPYWGLRSYLPANDEMKHAELGCEATPELYVANMVAVFREVKRVLRDDGTLWLNLGDSYAANRPYQVTDSKHVDVGNNGGMSVPTGLKPKDLCMIPARVALALQQPYYTGRIQNERDRVWLAAMIDGEGCMFIHKRKVGQSNGQGYARKNASYGAALEVANCSEAVVRHCEQITGLGSTCHQDGGRRQRIYRWSLRSNICREVIREVYPYLVAKQQEARLLLGCPSSGDLASAAHEALKGLHNGIPTDLDFPAPASMFGPGWYLRSDIIWSKLNPMPESVTDRPTRAHEYVFMLTKAARYWYDAEAIREDNSPTSWTGGIYHKDAKDVRAGIRNDYFHRAGAVIPSNGRNRRTVWTIATQPYPEAHFATYPEKLVEPCVLAGCPAKVCSECGAPWERVTVVTGEVARRWSANDQPTHDDNWRNDNGRSTQKVRETAGWQPTCTCSAGTIPGTVLDPFTGSGTTGAVACRLGRNFVGIELSPEYAEMAERRIAPHRDQMQLAVTT